MTPRVDLIEEAIASTDGASTTFAQREGPFTSYERTVVTGPKTVDETTFRAELSNRVEIAVGGKGDPARLTDLLNKAVVAVRGH